MIDMINNCSCGFEFNIIWNNYEVSKMFICPQCGCQVVFNRELSMENVNFNYEDRLKKVFKDADPFLVDVINNFIKNTYDDLNKGLDDIEKLMQDRSKFNDFTRQLVKGINNLFDIKNEFIKNVSKNDYSERNCDIVVNNQDNNNYDNEIPIITDGQDDNDSDVNNQDNNNYDNEIPIITDSQDDNDNVVNNQDNNNYDNEIPIITDNQDDNDSVVNNQDNNNYDNEIPIITDSQDDNDSDVNNQDNNNYDNEIPIITDNQDDNDNVVNNQDNNNYDNEIPIITDGQDDNNNDNDILNTTTNMARMMNYRQHASQLKIPILNGFNVEKNDNPQTILLASGHGYTEQLISDGFIEDGEFEERIKLAINKSKEFMKDNGLDNVDNSFTYFKDYHNGLFHFKVYIQDMIINDGNDRKIIRQMNAYFIEPKMHDFYQLSLAVGPFKMPTKFLKIEKSELKNDKVTQTLNNLMKKLLINLKYKK